MTIANDILINLAANLAADLITRAMDRLRSLAFGDPETKALRRAWETAFGAMLKAVTTDLDADHVNLLDDILRQFVATEGVTDALLDLALEGCDPPLALLGSRFDALDFDQVTLSVDFDTALTVLTGGLADALLAEAREPSSPLYNRVSLGRVLTIHVLLQRQRETLDSIASTIARIDGQGGRTVYNVVIQQATGLAIGDGAVAQLDPDLRRLLAQVRELLTQQILPYRPSTPFQAPPLPAHFVSRPEVSDDLKARLLADEVPVPGVLVVTAIHGLGGIGKSTLAAALAHEQDVQKHFTDGVLWATLGQQPDCLSLLRSWGQALTDQDFHPLTVEDASSRLRSLLHDKSALLVIDDVWQAEHARPFLVGGPHCRVLITTRDEELALALDATVHRLDVLPLKQAHELLAKLAGPVVEQERDAAHQLAERVGCLPLALELAGKLAARYSRKPRWRLASLCAQVQDRAADRALQLRGQRGLAATFSLSYEELDDCEQRLLRILGIFAPGLLRIAAVAGVVELDEKETEFALDELVSLALLAWGQTEGTCTMHPLLRQYAQTLLAETGEADEAEKRHLAYYLAFAQANARAELGAWDRLEEELPNLLLAAKKAAKVEDSAAMVSFEEALLHESRFLYVRGYYQEVIDLLSQSLAVQRSLGEQQNQPRTLNKLAFFYANLGQYGEAQEHADRAYSLAVVLDDQEQLADSLRYLGFVFDSLGKNELALEYFEEELDICHKLDDPARLAGSLINLGVVQIAIGNYAKAKQHIDEALAIYRQSNDLSGIAISTANRGITLLYLGDYANALQDFKEALERSQALNDREGIAQNLLNMGMSQNYLGDYSCSLSSLADALSQWQALGDKSGEALTLLTLAEVRCALGDYRRAEERLKSAQELIQEEDSEVIREVELEYFNTLGLVYCELGNYTEALVAYRRLSTSAGEMGSRFFLAQSKLGLARAYLAQDIEKDLHEAQRYATEAITLCQELQLAGDEPRGHAYLCKANLLLGNKEAALQSCRKAMDLLDKQKHVRGSEVEVYLYVMEGLEANDKRNEQRECLEAAYELVDTTAKKIKDETSRQYYLTVPMNQEILVAWAQMNAAAAIDT